MILGFLFALLVILLLAPAFWNRAVRLTTERIRASMPITVEEMQADKDQLRADFAVKLRQFEIKLEHAKLKTARQLIELSRKETEIAKTKNKILDVSTELEEQRNANEVMRQTIITRIPQMEAQLHKAKEMLGERYQEITKLKSTISQKEGELGEVKSSEQVRHAEILKLKSQFDKNKQSTTSLSASSIEEIGKLKETNKGLTAEVERLQEELRESNAKVTIENTQLKKELHKLADQILEITEQDTTDAEEEDSSSDEQVLDKAENMAEAPISKLKLSERLRDIQ